MTKKIPLTQGQYAIIDDEDFELVNQNSWCAAWRGKRYVAQATKKQKHIYMHRVIMNAPDDMVVDHINGDELDNRRSNLRVCTHAENIRNRGKNKNNTSGYKGVEKHGRGWMANIVLNRKKMYLGTFDSPVEAAKAYDAACKRLHAEFSNTNFE